MKALLLMTSNGPLLILSSHESPMDDVFLGKLKSKGIDKFIAYEIEHDKTKHLYGGHCTKVMHNRNENIRGADEKTGGPHHTHTQHHTSNTMRKTTQQHRRPAAPAEKVL